MAKKKSRAVVLIPNATGTMSEVRDRRFESGEWPIRLEIHDQDADRWLAYLTAECRKRGWQCPGIKQLEHAENSGSITIRDVDAVERLTVVWERKRNGPLRVSARPQTAEAGQLLEEVSERCRARVTERFYRRGLLHYRGLPWLGELWLADTLRLGPASQQDQTALIGPRCIIVDAEVEDIDWPDAASQFSVLLRELSVFLTVVLRTQITLPETDRVWTWTWPTTPDGTVSYEVRNLGYGEQNNPPTMPPRGQVRAIPTFAVCRPDFSNDGITASDTEQRAPEDIVSLWQAFDRLPANKRRDFLQAGTLYQLAFALFKDFRTASFAFMVATCEALKPAGRDFRDHNAYDVIEALIDKQVADELRAHRVSPQDVRSVQFHRGEFRADEFVPHTFTSSFDDPTFDEMSRQVVRVAQAATVEWLRRGGVVNLPTVQRRKTWRRWIKEHALILLPAAFLVGALAALALAWRR